MAGAVIAVCGAALVCALLAHFVTDGGTKKLISLIMGAFMVCSLIAPLKNTAEGFGFDTSGFPSYESIGATADEAYREAVLSQTQSGLEQTLKDMLLQEGIEAERVEIILALSDETRIIISRASIYMSREQAYLSERAIELTKQNFSVTPDIYTE